MMRTSPASKIWSEGYRILPRFPRLGYTPKIKLREIISRVIASKQAELEPVELPVTMGLRAHPLRAGVAE